MRKLPAKFVEKVWGVERLPAPFPHPSEGRIGEVWFEPPPELDQLLVKHIFASERLSVQVHPDNDQAKAMGLGCNGKSECWIILDAKPGATIAVGFHEDITAETMRAAALDGSIVDMLVWHEVSTGDAFYIPAGTVHAIGGGVSLVEVQQNCDITFRLFDYGRPRELHLDQGVEVAEGGPYPAGLRSKIASGSGALVDSPFFSLSYWNCGDRKAIPPMAPGPALVIPFAGTISIGGDQLTVGECALVDDLSSASPNGDATVLLAQAK